MLSGVLDSNYKRYKTDTSIFIEWLFENGTKCGYKVAEPSAPTNGGPPDQPKAPRLKGKARKEARKSTAKPSAKNSSSNASNAGFKNFRINSSELLPLANAIVTSKKHVKVPADIIRAGLRAVSARKRSAAFYQQGTNDEDEETAADNHRHSYFISLMEKVLSVLHPCFAVFAAAKSSEVVSPDNIFESLQNRFAALEVEEPVEPQIGPEPKAAVTDVVIYELENSKDQQVKNEERLFAIFCLFDDLARIRTFVLDLWKQYKVGKLDLITASVTTNTAFQLAIRTQDEILADFPASVDYESILAILLPEMTKILEKPTARDAEGEIDMVVGMTAWIYLPVYKMLESFCEVLRPGSIPLMKRGHFGEYNPRADRSRMHGSEQNQEDLIVLLEILPEFCFISKCDVRMFAKDELTRGLANLALTKEMPVWLIFATTIFLDIHHILREQVNRGLIELHRTAERAKLALEDYFELSKGLKKPNSWPMHNDLAYKQRLVDIEYFVLADAILPLKVHEFRKVNMPAPDACENFYLFSRHPVLCGIQAFAIQLEMQQLGIALNNAVGTVIFPAHLYNALKQNDSSCVTWPMMDEVIALHGADRIFLGAKPSTMADCFKQICLMLGHSVQDFAKNRRKTKPLQVSKNGPRGLRDTSPITELFYEGLRDPEQKMAVTFHNVEELLNEQARNEQLASNPTSKRLRREWATTKRLTSLELLQALRASLPQEIPKLEFDYFKLHAQSIGLLRRLKRDLDEDYKKYYKTPEYIENESQLPQLGPYAIMAAYNTEHTASGLGSQLLSKAAKVMENYLQEEGAI
ncbi:hypothetical protein DL98DRAFT_509345 [Cadophora sp. DSE1049]|nr:hypothetical protein DL98DRAFT_509345 [Cadophora sp. DSE1049]